MNRKIKKENIIRNILIILTIISLIIVFLNFTYLIYQDYNIETINTFLIKYINGPLLWIDNIMLYIFSIIYIIFAIKSKKEVLIKICFSIFSVITTMLFITLIINSIANIFSIF